MTKSFLALLLASLLAAGCTITPVRYVQVYPARTGLVMPQVGTTAVVPATKASAPATVVVVEEPIILFTQPVYYPPLFFPCCWGGRGGGYYRR
ncbi:MAG: hypothetical protein NTV60_03360 [Candidatus Kaiserbacteria bacterium]|nr:hypothetical protein [Candidatus Kaiserbacteria bacterium]